jgi:hypothetical protein
MDYLRLDQEITLTKQNKSSISLLFLVALLKKHLKELRKRQRLSFMGLKLNFMILERRIWKNLTQ